MVLAIGLGGPGLYAYKKGLLFFARAAPHDSTAALRQDTLAQRLLADTGASPPRGDTTAPVAARGPPTVPPGTPGRPTPQGLPRGAQGTLNGQLLRGAQDDVPPGAHQLPVPAA